MSATATAVLHSGAIKDTLIREMTETLKEINASEKSAASKEMTLASSLKNIFSDHGISVSASFTQYAARRMIGELPGQNIDTNDMTKLLEKYDVSVG